MKSKILGTGSYLPGCIINNEFFITKIDTSEEWILSRTGIRERRIASKGETTSNMAYFAALKALSLAKVDTNDIDWIIFSTVTPDYMFPQSSCLLQKKLEAKNAACLDINAGCSGFVYGLSLADSLIISKKAKKVLVVGSDTLSRITDYQDRQTAILFGDGAGCIILGLEENESGGFMCFDVGSDGDRNELIMLPAGGSAEPSSHKTISEGGHYIKLKGREVFKFATTQVPESINRVLNKNNLKKADWLIIHQANERIVNSISEVMGYPRDKVPSNIDKYGNTSSASIPILFDELLRANTFKKGEYIVFSGFGSGVTWATALYRF